MLRSECTQMVTKVSLGALSGRGGAEVDSLAGTIIIVKSRGAASRPHEDLEATRRAKRWSAHRMRPEPRVRRVAAVERLREALQERDAHRRCATVATTKGAKSAVLATRASSPLSPNDLLV